MKKILTVLLILAMVGGTAFAQSFHDFNAPPDAGVGEDRGMPTGFVGAPGAWSSRGLWSPQWHNIMAPAWHSGVNFENWTGFASFGEGSRFAMAYATRIGDMYLAAYLGGTGFGQFRPRGFTEEHSNNWGPTDAYRTFRNFDFHDPREHFNDNRVAILLGVAGMGFRLSYATTASSFRVSDAIVDLDDLGLAGMLPPAATTTTVYVEEANMVFGVRQLELGWGMSSNLLDIGVRPSAFVRLNFARNFSEANAFNWATGNTIGNVIAWSHNYVQPEIELQSGWVNFFTRDSGWTLRADLTYILGFRLFNNDFSEVDYSDPANVTTTTRSLSGGTVGFGGDEAYERSWMRHDITPRIQLLWTGERVALSTRLVLQNTITSEQTNPREWDDSANRWTNYDVDEVSTLTYSFLPRLEFGARWFAIPDRLTLLVGGQFEFGDITRTSTTTTEFDSHGNAVVRGETTAVEVAFEDANTTFRAGFTFHFNENFALDARTNVNLTPNIFGSGAGNLFTFAHIMGVFTF